MEKMSCFKNKFLKRKQRLNDKLYGKLLLVISLLFFLNSVDGQRNPRHRRKLALPMVEIRTSLGNIKVELYPDKAPVTVKNFLMYVKKKSYDGTIFHRVVAGFIIQGGGFDKNLKKRPTEAPIKNEANNGLNNKRGTIAMARTHIVDSATNQFFINLDDNYSLDHKYLDQAGYCVFGKVIAGMDVVDKIGKVKTNWKKRRKDVPVEDIIIKEIVKVN